MQTPLVDVATVHSGYALRTALEHDPDGDTRILQLSDINEHGDIKIDTLQKLQLGDKAQRYLVDEQDILLPTIKARQPVCRPMIARDSRVAPTSSLLRLTPNDAVIDGGYLCWVLSQPVIQHRIYRNSTGTSLQYINRQVLEHTCIPVPSMDTQKKVSEINSLHQQRTQKRANLALLDEKIVRATLWSLVNEQS